MKYFKINTIFAAIGVIATMLVSCSDNTTNTVDNSNRIPNPPTKLRATSIDQNTVRVKWDLSNSESDSLFTGYRITYNGSPTSFDLPKGTGMRDFANFLEGVKYTIKVVALFSNGNTSSVDSVIWSPASRFVTNINDAPIRIYETASSFGSGLQLYEPTNQKPKGLKVASGSDWNLGIYTTNYNGTSGLMFGSPDSLNYSYTGTPKITEISSDYYDEASSLDEIFDTQALDAANFSPGIYDLTQFKPTNGALVFIVRTYESGLLQQPNYAKVLIKYVNNSFLQGSGSDRYIECVISYQLVKGVPFAITAPKADNQNKTNNK